MGHQWSHMLPYIFGVELLKRSFSTHTPRHTAEDSIRNTTVPRYRSISAICYLERKDRARQERYLDVRHRHLYATSM